MSVKTLESRLEKWLLWDRWSRSSVSLRFPSTEVAVGDLKGGLVVQKLKQWLHFVEKVAERCFRPALACTLTGVSQWLLRMGKQAHFSTIVVFITVINMQGNTHMTVLPLVNCYIQVLHSIIDVFVRVIAVLSDFSVEFFQTAVQCGSHAESLRVREREKRWFKLPFGGEVWTPAVLTSCTRRPRVRCRQKLR